MPTYTCDLCDKQFGNKANYSRHINKKKSCNPEKKIIEKIKEPVKEEVNKDETDLSILETFFKKCHNILRDEESIVTMEAMNNISDLLFLRLIQRQIKNGEIDLLNLKYYDHDINKEDIKYCQWDELTSLLKNNKKEVGETKLFEKIHFIWNNILNTHPKTKKIFNDRSFDIKKQITFTKLVNEINKIDFDNMKVDVKGKAYEHFIGEISGAGKFGQFFTPRWIIKFMVKHINPKVNDNGSYEKLLDPACGTGGFLCEYYNSIKKIAEERKIVLDNNISKFIHGNEILSNTHRLGLINMLMATNEFNINVQCTDSIRNIIQNKYDIMLLNPPFKLDTDYKAILDANKSNAEFKNYLPIKIKSIIGLFIQLTIYCLKEKGRAGMISSFGQEIFSNKPEFVEIRKYLMEKCNLTEIFLLPSGSFTPYTAVDTLIMFFEKGNPTKKIQFKRLQNDEKIEKICDVDINEIINNNYSLNYREYSENIKGNIEFKYEKLGNICEFIIPNKKRNANDHVENGIYPLYNCSIYGHLLINEYDYEDEILLINKVNGLGKSNIYYNNGKYCVCNGVIQFKSKNDNVNIKYIYAYLKNNIHLLENGYMGSNQKTITNDYIDNIKIPIPPLEDQTFIINMVDSYEKSIKVREETIPIMENMKINIMNQILKNYKCDKIELKNLCNKEIRGGGNKPSDNKKGTLYPYYGTSEITGYTDEYLVDGNYILVARSGNAGNVIKVEGKSFPSRSMCIIEPNNKILFGYLYYSLKYGNLSNLARGAVIPGITIPDLEKKVIYYPSKEDQEKIVKEMEQYDEAIEMDKKMIPILKNDMKKFLNNYFSDKLNT